MIFTTKAQSFIKLNILPFCLFVLIVKKAFLKELNNYIILDHI
jgi:hypothetical protein